MPNEGDADLIPRERRAKDRFRRDHIRAFVYLGGARERKHPATRDYDERVQEDEAKRTHYTAFT